MPVEGGKASGWLAAIVAVTALVVLLAASAPAAAASPKSISGELSERGYTVIALAASGEARSVRVKRRRFRLRPPAGHVTLHLRGRDGSYAGPVVVGRAGKRAIVGVRAGARLGKVRVLRGYARVARRLPRRWMSETRYALARKGVPIGTRSFGRVRSRGRGAPGPGRDQDRDGIPSAFDIDDDGDLVLDNVDRSTRARKSQVAEQVPDDFIKSGLGLALHETANANAGTLTAERMDTMLASIGTLLIEIMPGTSQELDCGGDIQDPPRPFGLVYCSLGGTGRLAVGGGTEEAWAPFPDCCDPDGDGAGSLTGTPQAPGPTLFLHHGATTDQIGTGDVLIQRVVKGGVASQFLATVQYVLASVPALVSYSDGQGNATAVAYPVAAGYQPGEAPGPGERGNPFPVRADASGNVILELTLWRPQRKPIPPETGDWIDIGGLTYTAGLGDTGIDCPQDAYSERDPNLTSAPSYRETIGGGLTDLARDRPASRANTLTYSVNLTRCLAAVGRTFNPGETRELGLGALACANCDAFGDSSGPDSATQVITFRRE